MQTLVAFAPDPYIALNFKNSCFDSELLVCVNGARKEIVDFIADIYKDYFVIKSYEPINQGKCFNKLYANVTGNFATMDSDNFICQKGVFKEYANMLKEFDMVGSSGKHIKPSKMAEEVYKKFGIVRLNPFMSFWKKPDFEFSFDMKFFHKGETYNNFTMVDDAKFDIMTLMTLDCKIKGYKEKIIKENVGNKHFHVSALSNAIYDNLQHDDGLSLAGTVPRLLEYKLKKELLANWLHCYKKNVSKCPFDDFNKMYIREIKRKCVVSGFNFQEVEILADSYIW